MEKRPDLRQLSRRERQIMDIVYKLGSATAVEVLEKLPDAPGNPTVRKQLTKLEEKGFLTHDRDGKRFVYRPVIPADKARTRALDNMLDTFFRGSAARAVVALIDKSKTTLSDNEREMITRMIEELKREGK